MRGYEYINNELNELNELMTGGMLCAANSFHSYNSL